jgi:rhamnulose-1-phosphate aldolase/alcohol dehydrogenase
MTNSRAPSARTLEERPMSGDASRTHVPLPDLWDDAYAATLDEPGRLIYRSNLLGADLRITNYGGGNTSAKVDEIDPLTGEKVKVLWVKGSGGDLASITRDGFATLYLDKLLSLKNRDRAFVVSDDIVPLFDQCAFNLSPRAPSIETPSHGLIPHAHVDHVHADPIIAIATCDKAEALTREIYGDEIGFVPWQRLGFDLGLKLAAIAEENPRLKGAVLGNHGLVTWGETSKACYQTTLAMINKALAWLAANRKRAAFGGAIAGSLSPAERREVAATLMTAIRKRVSAGQRKIGHFIDSPETLEFVNSRDLKPLAAVGTSCPDHFLRTKIRPLVLPFDPATNNVEAVVAALDGLLEAYRGDYAAYYQRCKRPNSPAMRDPNAVIYLVPGVGMLSFAKDKPTARVAAEFYVNAINVMRDAESVGKYVAISEQEAFDIEYWILEEAKLQRLPKLKSLAGRGALVAGGAGAVGRAIAARLASEGAGVALVDVDAASLESAVADLRRRFGKDAATGVAMDATRESAVETAFRDALLACGGIDIVVSAAGDAAAAPFEDASLELWRRAIATVATGGFLAARAGYRIMKDQGAGGSIVFVGPADVETASAGAAVACAAEGAEIHLARGLAREGAAHRIRVNAVSAGAPPREAEIAEAVAYFASDRSAGCTGAVLSIQADKATA